MDKQQLANKIWQAANKMRSKIEANEYKDYILGFIFYKFLSDREEQIAREDGWTDEDIKNEFHETNAEVVDDIRVNRGLGYFIAYENLYSTWLKAGKNGEADFTVANVRDALSAFSRMIAPSHRKVFAKIFNTLETGLSKLGDTAASQTRAIKSLLDLIKDIPMDGRQDYDVLGFVYEYLIGMFAANAGKKAGEFYTPHEVAVFMANIVANHLKDRDKIEIYDPTSGSGSLLINIGRAVSRNLNDADKIKYYAQELKENTFNLTRMNLVMRGIRPANIEVRNGDTLERDWPYFDESNPDGTYTPLFVDAVVSNPPYSQHWNPAGRDSDVRFASFGLAPKSKADYAFLLHDLYHLRDNGIMTIVMPHGVLFRGKPDDGSEGSIRRALVEGNHIDAIIGLPPNIFFGTGIPTIVMVLRKHRDSDETLIVDASRGFVKDGKKNRLRASDMKRITDVVIAHQEVPGFSRRVSRDEIRRNEYNLNIPRYVTHDEAEHWDVRAVINGGLPVRELDGLNAYWEVFAGLRGDLFEVKDNYASVKVDSLEAAVRSHRSVRQYSTAVSSALDGFGAFLERELIDGSTSVAINTEEDRIAGELFRRLGTIPLLDIYESYQILDDEWRQTAIDLEIIQSEGFGAVRKVDPNMVIKKSGDKDVEVQNGWKGRIIPFDLVKKTFFAESLSVIEQRSAEADRIAAEIVSLASEVSEEDREELIEDEGEEFDPKKVAAKVEEILRDNGAMPNKKALVVSAAAALDLPEGSTEATVVKAYLKTLKEKGLRSEIRALEKSLDAKAKAKVESLTDEEARELLKRKWVSPVVEKLVALPEAIVANLVGEIKAISGKYSTTLMDIADRVSSAERELSEYIRELTGTPDDIAGLASFAAIAENMFPAPGETRPRIRFKGFDGEWVEKRLGDCGQITMGQSPDARGYNMNGVGLPLIQGNADIEQRNTIVRKWTSVVTKKATAGNIILTVRAPVGYVARTSFDCCIGRGVCAIDDSSCPLLYSILEKRESKWSVESAGSTFDSITSEKLSSVLISLPPTLAEQRKIGAYFRALDALIAARREEVAKLGQMKAAMLEAMFV